MRRPVRVRDGFALARRPTRFYTGYNNSVLSIGMRIVYRQNYRPHPAIRLPRWAKSLWRWL